ncbi:MAG: sigma 54-interacting transcriptional regulator [Desulfarculaceae bacterium]|nr:sigma 54-interacting transcriptional regulator [Desulfarculaceae bacterium]
MDPARLKLMRQMVEAAREGVLAVDRDGVVLVCNLAARHMIGVAGGDPTGRNLAEIDPALWDRARAVISSGEACQYEETTPDGGVISAGLSPFAQHGETAGVFCLLRPGADCERLAQELAVSKELSERLDMIIESSHDGLWINDAQGVVIKVNAASARRMGLPAEAIVGRHVRELVEEGFFDFSATLEVLRTGQPVTLQQNLKDGGQALVTGTPVFDDKGELSLVVVNDRDMTSIEELRALLKESRAHTQQFRSELIRSQISQDLDSKLVVRSAPMRRTLETALRVARTESNVLITGESGVGKGLVAKVIHEASARRREPLVRVDCGAIPASLIEAELFGYEKGAFTGALDAGKPGYFEMARGGTLFLDEVGELPLNVQAKLLRFLDEKEVVRVGSTAPLVLDVRILAATNRNLKEMVAQGSFRKDLFFRLSVVPLALPPLRERPEDIPPLVNFFLRRLETPDQPLKNFAPAVLECLRRYAFPGNVRELANLVEQLAVLTPGARIELADLPPAVQNPDLALAEAAGQDDLNLARAVDSVERQLIIRALKIYGSQRQAAKYLGVSHATLSRKIARLGIVVT